MLGRRRALPGPQHVNDPVHGHQGRPLHREQLQQRAGLAAAHLALGQLRAAADDAESPGQAQLDLLGTGRCDENILPHQHFLPLVSTIGKSRGSGGRHRRPELPRLLYVKAPAPDRAPGLADLLARIKEESSISYAQGGCSLRRLPRGTSTLC